jgi:hypothetical protein
MMTSRGFSSRHFLILAVTGMILALGLAGCFSMGSVVSGAVGQNASSQQQAQPAPAQPAEQSQPAQQPSSAAMAYQYQFNAFYGAMWNFGWFGYKDANYKPGQGTVWQITSSRNSKTTTFERAFLKANADQSQWWRLKITGGKDEIVYEFLVGADTKVQKVRYKDPQSGEIGEFIPDQSGSQQQGMPAQPTRQQLASSLVGTESVQVKAGTFTADHYSYTDPQNGYKGDSWISKKVPGYMVKFTGSNSKNNVTSSGELIQIETGVTTALGSY